MMVSLRETRDELSPNVHAKTDDELKGFAGTTIIIAESPHAMVESGKINVNAEDCVVAVGDLHEGRVAAISSRSKKLNQCGTRMTRSNSRSRKRCSRDEFLPILIFAKLRRMS